MYKRRFSELEGFELSSSEDIEYGLVGDMVSARFGNGLIWEGRWLFAKEKLQNPESDSFFVRAILLAAKARWICNWFTEQKSTEPTSDMVSACFENHCF